MQVACYLRRNRAGKKNKSSTKETSANCCGKENSAGQGARCCLKLPACISDMSVLDVLVHTVGARAAKIRLDKPKESENDAVVNVYSDYFFDPFDDETHKDKATREEEDKEEAELEEAEEMMMIAFIITLGEIM